MMVASGGRGGARIQKKNSDRSASISSVSIFLQRSPSLIGIQMLRNPDFLFQKQPPFRKWQQPYLADVPIYFQIYAVEQDINPFHNCHFPSLFISLTGGGPGTAIRDFEAFSWVQEFCHCLYLVCCQDCKGPNDWQITVHAAVI